MAKRLTSMRVLFTVLLLGLFVLDIGALAASAQITDPQGGGEFAQILGQSSSLPPVFGPASADLPFEAWEDCPECTMAAGVSLSDIHVHLEFDLLDPSLPGGFFLAIRQADQQALDVLSPNFVTAMGSTWLVGGSPVEVTGLPSSVDVIAIGGQGYLGLDGQFVTSFDLTQVQGPGDVVLTAGVLVDYSGSTLGVKNFTVWDLSAGQSAPGTGEVQAPASSVASFETYRQMALSQPVLFGPESGTIAHDPETVLFASTGVMVSDFSARIVCQEPVPSTTGLWDCGFAFRDITSANYFVVGVATDGRWFASTGSSLPVGEGIVPAGVITSNAFMLELIVVGATGYLAVNDVFVTELDLSAIPGPGTVAAATAFYASTSVPGGETLYENFTVTSLDVPAASVPGQAPVEAGAVLNGTAIAGTTYTSPTYGYTLTWDNTWTVLDEGVTDWYDFLTLSNGAVTADLYSINADQDATECNEDLMFYYQGDPDYSDVAYLLDSSGNPLVIPGTDHASAWVGFTYTDDSGISTQYYELDVCLRMPDGSAMIQLELQVAPADAEANLAAIEQLAMGIGFGLLSNPILDVKSG